jgi:cephalosporin hydroxylase
VLSQLWLKTGWDLKYSYDFNGQGRPFIQMPEDMVRLQELELYAPLVTPGCYLVVADGVMTILHDAPRGMPEWHQDNPGEAAREFLASHSELELDPSYTKTGVAYFQGGYLRRI